MVQHERLRRLSPGLASVQPSVAPPEHAIAAPAAAALPGYSYARSAPVVPLRVADATDPMELEAEGVAAVAAGGWSA